MLLTSLVGAVRGRVRSTGRRPWPLPATGDLLLCALIAVLLALTSARAGAEDRKPATITPAEHPNHFIILVDSSGSLAWSNAKAPAFRDALDYIAEGLYETGFDGELPRLDPMKDFVSVHHFGIDAGNPTSAYKRLRTKTRLQAELVHTRISPQRGVTRARLREQIQPDVRYALTILVWAQHLSLQASELPNASETEVARTFLVQVHDASPNDGSLDGEKELFYTHGNRVAVEATESKVKEIQGKYSIAGGEDPRAPLLRQEFATLKHDPVFVEVFKVTAKERDSFEERLAMIEPIAKATHQWVAASGSAPEGEVMIKFNEEFLSLLSSSQLVGIQVDIPGVNSAPQTLGPAALTATLPVTWASSATCAGWGAELRVTAEFVLPDNRLGLRRATYSRLVPFQVGPSPWCTVGRWLAILAVALLAAAIVLGILYLRHYSRVGTHIRIEAPDLIRPFALQWGKVDEHPGLLHITSGVPAIHLLLPAYALQVCLYRGTTLSVATRSELHHAYFIAREPAATITLPSGRHRLALAVRSESKTQDPLWVTIQATARGRVAEYRIGFLVNNP